MNVTKIFFTLPRQPYHIQPAHKSNQLCHDVINTCTFQPTKANQFSNTYQIHKQMGSFQGINTRNICSVGDFSFPYVILDESESRTIINKPDINTHLDKLSNDGFLTKNSVEIRRKMARDIHTDTKIFEPYYDGCTYVSLEDTM